MSTLLVVRHAAHDWLGKGVPGRLPGVSLNAQGCEQAESLAAGLDGMRIDAICCSPQVRTRETAAPLAARRGLAVQVEPGFDEIDFGDWTGLSFDSLAADPLWGTWVHRRSVATPPGGEPFADVQQRAREAADRLALQRPDQSVLVVSHGDVIKALLAWHLRVSLDDLERFDIAPASVSVIEMQPGWSQVRLVNWRPGLVQD